jgi:copper transporter 1
MATREHWTRTEWLLLLLGGVGCIQLLLELLASASVGATAAASAPPAQHGHSQGNEVAGTPSEIQHGHHSGTKESQHAASGGGDPFCTGMPMVMGGMQGFSRESCVVLFFAQWDVTSAARMWLATLGVLSLGIAYEYLKGVERETYEHTRGQLPLAPGTAGQFSAGLKGQPAGGVGGLSESRMLRALLHGLNIAIAYLCMFVAMTFNPLLFLTQIVGFVLGHFLFGPQPGRHGTSAAIAAADGDPCCD